MIEEDFDNKILIFIIAWSIAILVVLVIWNYLHQQFISKHPELHKQSCDPMLKRKHRKFALFFFGFINVWILFLIIGVQWFLKQFSLLPILVLLACICLILFKMNKCK